MRYFLFISIILHCSCSSPTQDKKQLETQQVEKIYNTILQSEDIAVDRKPLVLDSLLSAKFPESAPSYSHIALGQLYTDAKTFLMALKHFEQYITEVPSPDPNIEFCAYMRGYVMVLEYEKYGNERVQKYAEYYLKEYAKQYPNGEFAQSIPSLLSNLNIEEKESE